MTKGLLDNCRKLSNFCQLFLYLFHDRLEIRCAHAPIRTGKNLEKTSVSTAGDWGDTYTRRSEAELESEI